MMHKAWCNVEEVPYTFSRSSINFQGHTGWKIDDLNRIWVRLLGRSQLSNPSDLPCSIGRRQVIFVCWIQYSKLGSLRHKITSRLAIWRHASALGCPCDPTLIKYIGICWSSNAYWHQHAIIPSFYPNQWNCLENQVKIWPSNRWLSARKT